MPALETSETDETSLDGRDRRYASATSSSSGMADAAASDPRLRARHRANEVVEEAVRVPWPGRGLGVVLHGEDRERRVAEALERPVVQIAVRRDAVRRERVGVHREPVV